jgi:cytochrome c-type biogenesis protein CcmE
MPAMRPRRSPARLVIALSVAAVLAVFLLYTSIAGGGTPTVAPSELGARTDEVSLGGIAAGPRSGDAHAGGLRFRLRDLGSGPNGKSVAVLYRGSVPSQFKIGRELVVEGRLRNGVFVANEGSMITKCPSKYLPKKSQTSAS